MVFCFVVGLFMSWFVPIHLQIFSVVFMCLHTSEKESDGGRG